MWCAPGVITEESGLGVHGNRLKMVKCGLNEVVKRMLR